MPPPRQDSGFWSGFWGGGGGGGGGPADRSPAPEFSLAELKRAHGVLQATPAVTPATRAAVVEALRRTAELVAWGDAHDASLVDYFLEARVLAHVASLAASPAGRAPPVGTQLLQSLAILVACLKTRPAAYYLFSGGVLDAVLRAPFDLGRGGGGRAGGGGGGGGAGPSSAPGGGDNDELVGHYVGLLKAVAARLDGATVQCFFHDGAPASEGAPPTEPSFPLFARAAELAHHGEPLVRAAARGLLLRIYSIDDAGVRSYAAHTPAGRAAAAAAAAAVADAAADLRSRLARDDAVGGGGAGLENAAREIEDGAGFGADVYAAAVGGDGGRAAPPPVAALLADAMWARAVVPAVLEPLAALAGLADEDAAAGGDGGSDADADAAPAAPAPPPAAALAARAALHVAQTLLAAAPDGDGGAALAGALLLGAARRPAAGGAGAGGADTGAPARRAPPPPPAAASPSLEARAASGALAALRSADGGVASAAALAVAAAAAAAPDAVLAAAGLLPASRRTAWALLGQLTDGGSGGGDGSDRPSSPPPLPPARCEWRAELAAALARRPGLTPAAARAAAAVLLATSPDRDDDGGGGGGGGEAPRVAAGLRAHARRARAALAAAARGPWADALPGLVAAEWGPCRTSVSSVRPMPTPAAVAAWRCAASDADAARAARASPDRPTTARAPPSAPAALAALRAVQASVLAALVGEGAAGRPLPVAPPPTVAAAPPAVDPPDDAAAALTDERACSVAFARGQERRVVLARARGAPRAVAAAVLADPGPARGAGRVLCGAPLLGAACEPDPRHARWLHVAVRPPAAGLLRAAAGGSAGGRALAAALVDGHWVLAFPDAAAAADAAAALADAADVERERIRGALAGLLGGGGGGGGGEEDAAVGVAADGVAGLAVA